MPSRVGGSVPDAGIRRSNLHHGPMEASRQDRIALTGRRAAIGRRSHNPQVSGSSPDPGTREHAPPRKGWVLWPAVGITCEVEARRPAFLATMPTGPVAGRLGHSGLRGGSPRALAVGGAAPLNVEITEHSLRTGTNHGRLRFAGTSLWPGWMAALKGQALRKRLAEPNGCRRDPPKTLPREHRLTRTHAPSPQGEGWVAKAWSRKASRRKPARKVAQVQDAWSTTPESGKAAGLQPPRLLTRPRVPGCGPASTPP